MRETYKNMNTTMSCAGMDPGSPRTPVWTAVQGGWGWALLALAALTFPGGPLAAQEPDSVRLTLEEAVEEALRGNSGLGAAQARAEAAEKGAQAAEGFLYPMVQATAGVTRTDDPVGVFGTKLRQGRFTAEDFDLPALNDPSAVNDWTAGLGVQWDVADYARWVERDAGDARSRAAHAMVDRTREGTILRTRILYVGAVRAEAALEAVQAAEASAAATTDRVRRRVQEGMGTEADLLQAEAALSGVRAQRLHAQSAVVDAREALGNHLGWSDDRIPVPGDGADVLTRGDVAPEPPATELTSRADLVAGRAGVEAAQAEARAVQARRLPSVQAFGMLSSHAPDFSGEREANWTMGLQLSVPLFTGFSLTRGTEAAQAQARALALEQDQREREARTEVRSAHRRVETAREALESARAAAEAAQEAVRLLRRRYEEGMVTIADLLQAEAQSASLNRGVVDAEANLSVALASLDFVRGETAGLDTRDNER